MKKHSKHKLYKVWNSMKQRCYNVKDASYASYGGRGIKMDYVWKECPQIFILWALRNGWKTGLQIDRIDNDGDYEPDNCRFSTPRENALNRRFTRNTSGFKGVVPVGDRWRSQITSSGAFIHLGYFDSPRMAACRYDVEAMKLGHVTNF